MTCFLLQPLLPTHRTTRENCRNAKSTTAFHEPDHSSPNPATHSPNPKSTPIPCLAWPIHVPSQSLLAMFRRNMLPQFSRQKYRCFKLHKHYAVCFFESPVDTLQTKEIRSHLPIYPCDDGIRDISDAVAAGHAVSRITQTALRHKNGPVERGIRVLFVAGAELYFLQHCVRTGFGSIQQSTHEIKGKR